MKPRSTIAPIRAKQGASRLSSPHPTESRHQKPPQIPSSSPNGKHLIGLSPEALSIFGKYEKMSPFEIKDKLISLAGSTSRKSAISMLNAGRGNPNWVATTPREAFFLLGQFGMTESKRVMNLPDLGGMPEKEGIAERLKQFLRAQNGAPGADFLRKAIDYGLERLGFEADPFVHELVDSIIGDNYPVPDRMLLHSERVVHEYLSWAMCDNRPPQGKFDLFAVEGGTAAMCYVFRSLVQNKILRHGDTIALGTPIFTPYLEMPHLNDYAFKTVNIQATQENRFQFSDKELAKLEDPKIKAFCLVNPGNPSSVAISQPVMVKLVELVNKKRPDLIIVTDDVYGTFVRGFRSVMAELPHNTIGVYSYSKYFGCTGWRLGVIALHENNILDRMIQRLSPKEKAELKHRYGSLTLEPEKIKFIDRLVADSRDVALNHTAGLSLPQQVQMTLFSLFQLLDEDRYRTSVMNILNRRLQAALNGLGIDPELSPLFTAYYGIVDFEFWMRRYGGEAVVEFMKEYYHPLDIVYRLAADHAMVLLNGGGFEAPDWSVRISFANLDDRMYEEIGRAVRAVARTYVEAYRFAYSESSPLKPRKRTHKSH